jgi:hypothetical protein
MVHNAWKSSGTTIAVYDDFIKITSDGGVAHPPLEQGPML